MMQNTVSVNSGVWVSLTALLVACQGSAGDNRQLARNRDGGVGQGSPYRCAYAAATGPEHCSCNAIPPVDIQRASPVLEVWPFGVHAKSGHTEGHRGLDFSARVPDGTTVDIEVVSPVDGTVINIDNAQDSSGGLAQEFDLGDPAVHFTKIAADCGIVVVFIPLRLDASIATGVRVSRGGRLGILPKTRMGESGTNTYSSHFEFDVDSGGDSAYYAVCPAFLFGQTEREIIDSLTSASRYDEKSARTVSISCDSGTSQTFDYPAEDKACNPRLAEPIRNALSQCLPSRSNMIW